MNAFERLCRISHWISRYLAESCQGKLLSPSRRRRCVDLVRERLNVTERRACLVLGQHRSTQRKVPQGREMKTGLLPI